jgi:hypothetical protein
MERGSRWRSNRAHFNHDRFLLMVFPQGLKPLAVRELFGTTEVVP